MTTRIKTCSNSPMIYNSSASYTFQSSCEATKNIWQWQLVVLMSKSHEIKFLESSEWRKVTLMPVLKVRAIRMESKDCYPKNAEVEVQRVEKVFTDIKQISLPEALYLLRDTILGLEVLTEKYGRIDIDQIGCGVNTFGKCKLWLTDLTVLMKRQKVSSSTPGELLLSVFTLIFGMVKSCYRRFLKSLYVQITENTAPLSFSNIQRKMRVYIQQRRINVPDSLNTLNQMFKKISINNIRKYIIRSSLSRNKRRKVLSPYNCSQPASGAKRKSQLILSTKASVQIHKNLERNNQTSSMTSLKSLPKNQNQGEKKPSLAHQNRQSLNLANSYPIKFSLFVSPNKKSDTTTHITDNTYGSKDDLPFEKLTNSYRQTSSILMENLKQPKVNFNLGELDPVPEYEAQNSISGQGKMSESVVSYSQEERDEVCEIKSSAFPSQISDKFWEKKFVNLFEQSVKELKESVHCGGEEKKALSYQRQLLMLGKFGRKICGSICPVDGRM